MRFRLIPWLMVLIVVAGAALLITESDPTTLSLGAPSLTALTDVDGVETEVAIAPDGTRYAIVASGDLWYVDFSNDVHERLTMTEEAETAPAWTHDGTRITFTRGEDTFSLDPAVRGDEPYRPDAKNLVWSSTGQQAFVRDRALWVTRPEAPEGIEIVAADVEPNITIISPRFSPDGNRIVFIKSALGLRGELWMTDLDSGGTVPLVRDRNTENPTSVDWVTDDRHIAYLTNRSGGLTVWYIDLDVPSLVPLTSPMMERSVGPLGIAAHDGRIVVPRHFLDSDVTTSGGVRLIDTDHLALDPSISLNGGQITYTVANQGQSEIWIADRNGDNRRYVDLGEHPRFSPNGSAIVYSQTGLDGNADIWKFDLRTDTSERLTDDPEIDDTPDWSPDGRSIIFSSNRRGRLSMWHLPASGGRRSRLPVDGFAPRFSPDGGRIAFWNQGHVWTVPVDGTTPTEVGPAPDPVFPAWNDDGAAYFAQGAIRSARSPAVPRSMWGVFDRWPDGGWLISDLQIERTELWALDLKFEEQ